MIHFITPFTRIENLNFYMRNLDKKNIIWHPIFPKNYRIEGKSWIENCLIENIPESSKYKNVYKTNYFIENALIVDEDYYGFLNDDDWFEDDVIKEIDKLDDPLVFCAMKRGDNIPEEAITKHGTSTLIPYNGVKAGGIGIEQIFVKGKVLKEMRFEDHGMFDGLMAEELQKKYHAKCLPNVFVLFNYLEKGRWNIKGDIKMETVKERFERFRREPRDINEHLDTLLRYANDPEVNTIVELGVNEGVSTTAFLMSGKKFYNVDVHIEKTFAQLLEMCKNENREINFTLADDLTIEIPECDLLFIDTNHIYDHLIKELNMHAIKSSKFIIIHDTYTFGTNGIVPGTKGLMFAIDEFLEANSNWGIKEHFVNNNGLTVLERS